MSMKTLDFQFAPVPTAFIRDPNFTHLEKVIYAVIRSFGEEGVPGSTFPSRRIIAVNASCSISSVARAIKKLRAAGRLTYISGHSDKANTYEFPNLEPLGGSVTGDTTLGSGVILGGVIEDTALISQVTHHPEPSTKNYNQEGSLRLFHGGDICSVKENGTINILTRNGDWVLYPGGDDDLFRFGKLNGTEAKKAALVRFCVNKKREPPPSPSEYATD